MLTRGGGRSQRTGPGRTAMWKNKAESTRGPSKDVDSSAPPPVTTFPSLNKVTVVCVLHLDPSGVNAVQPRSTGQGARAGGEEEPARERWARRLVGRGDWKEATSQPFCCGWCRESRALRQRMSRVSPASGAPTQRNLPLASRAPEGTRT